MDPLDLIAAPATDLLDRVDEVLAVAGAPPEHRLWPLLRGLGALPGDVLHTFVGLRAAPLRAAADRVRARAGGYEDAQAALRGVAWEGAGGQAYDHVRAALAAHLAGVPHSLTGRLEATAGYLTGVAEWIERSRRSLARTLADALASAEAVAVVTAGAAAPGPAAAAEIGARVLTAAVAAADDAETLLRRFDPGLARLDFRVPAGVPSRLDGITRVGE